MTSSLGLEGTAVHPFEISKRLNLDLRNFNQSKLNLFDVSTPIFKSFQYNVLVLTAILKKSVKFFFNNRKFLGQFHHLFSLRESYRLILNVFVFDDWQKINSRIRYGIFYCEVCKLTNQMWECGLLISPKNWTFSHQNGCYHLFLFLFWPRFSYQKL